MLQIVASLIDHARVKIYYPSQCNYSFIVMAIVITIVNNDHSVITIINYIPQCLIHQATGSLIMYFI
jgi:hypothetical protein